MIYRKNLFSWEQVGRVGLGLAAMAAGMLAFETVNGYWILVGAILVVTGLFGFCPACYLVGRRVPRWRITNE